MLKNYIFGKTNTRCILLTILFMAYLYASSFIVSLFYAIKGGDITVIQQNTCLIVAEIITLALVLVTLILSKLKYVLKPSKFNLKNDIGACAFFIVFLWILFISVFLNIQETGYQLETRVILAVIYFIVVGITEELMFRGIIAEMQLDSKIDNKNGILKATVFSGFLFGIMHLINIFSMSPVGVLWQTFAAVGLGMALTAVFYRTGNIYIVMAIHALNDVAVVLNTNIVSSTSSEVIMDSVSQGVGAYDFSKIIGFLLYAGVAIFLISGKKKESAIQNKFYQRKGIEV